MTFRSGSIVVDYRVSWTDADILNEEILNNTLSQYLNGNHGYLYSYFVPSATLEFKKQVDKCAMQTSELK